MPRNAVSLLPSTERLLLDFGKRLRLARLRRQLTAKQVAERANIAPMTLRSLERGSSGVTMGSYLCVMQVLGIETDLSLVGQADPVGRALQDARLTQPFSAMSSRSTATRERAQSPERSVRATRAQSLAGNRGLNEVVVQGKSLIRKKALSALESDESKKAPRNAHFDWSGEGYVSADALARLIKHPAPTKKKAR